jgi:hypothetical protein
LEADMETNSAPDTLAELPHVDTLRPPPLPSDATLPGYEIVDVADLVYHDATEPTCIPKGHARAALAGALLDAYRAIYCLENIAAAIIRASDLGEDTRLPVEGSIVCARDFIRGVGALVIGAARNLDQGGQ